MRTFSLLLLALAFSLPARSGVVVTPPIIRQLESVSAVATIVLSCSPTEDDYEAHVISGYWLDGSLPKTLRFAPTTFDWPRELAEPPLLTLSTDEITVARYFDREQHDRIRLSPMTAFTDTFVVAFNYRPDLPVQTASLSVAIQEGEGLLKGIRMYSMGFIEGREYKRLTVRANRSQWHAALRKSLRFIHNEMPNTGND